MKPTGTDDKPAAIQASLERLLSAAYVVQQHNERLQLGQPPDTGYSQILKEILEVQEQLRGAHLDVREKSALIARRIRQMTQASGSAVGIVKGTQLEYYAATGSAASQAGATVSVASSLAHACLQSDELLQSPNAEADSRLDAGLCRSLGVKALIAVPVKQAGELAGVLELHFAQASDFHDEEVRIAQLMSALVAEAIVKPLREEAHPQIQQPPAELPNANLPDVNLNIKDTESLLAALQKIRPKLEQLAGKPGMAPVASSTGTTPVPSPSNHSPSSSPAAGVCRGCGEPMAADEIFCAGCGSPRQTNRLWSSLLELQRKAENSAGQSAASATSRDAFDEPLDVFPSELEEIVAKFSTETFDEPAHQSHEVSLPSFAQELVADTTPTPSEEQVQLEQHPQWEEEELPGNENIEADQQLNPPVHEPAEASPDNGRPFLIEKSPESVASVTAAYPPFTGFASDTNLLSLRSETEPEAPSAPAEPHGAPVPWKPNAVPADGSAPWGSAAKTKEWLESQRGTRVWLARNWQEQRANIYLLASGLLLAVVLLEFAAPSLPVAPYKKITAAGTHGQETPPPPPELSLSEKLLVGLGLAEAPAPQAVDPGNPDTKVWLDVHTALYYCPGADLYGKTSGGRTVTQQEAREDQFQPAIGKACN